MYFWFHHIQVSGNICSFLEKQSSFLLIQDVEIAVKHAY